MTEPLREAGLAPAHLERLANAGLRVAVAESLTGGLLADAFVSVSGASSVFSGGIVSYDTALKHSLLSVDARLLRERGPVDADVARQMALGVRSACAVPRSDDGEPVVADIGLSTTGVAGPEPDPQTGQPAGTVWLGVSSRLGERAVELSLEGDRADIRRETVRLALQQLSDELDALEGLAAVR